MRATSLSLTVEPSAFARSTMSPNCAVEFSWPLTTTVAKIAWPGTLGKSPIVPEETCAFCAEIAADTLAVDRLKPVSFCGSIQMRIARSVPKSCAVPTPCRRWISGNTLREA